MLYLAHLFASEKPLVHFFLGPRLFVHQKLHKSTTENCKLVSTEIFEVFQNKPGSAPECSSQNQPPPSPTPPSSSWSGNVICYGLSSPCSTTFDQQGDTSFPSAQKKPSLSFSWNINSSTSSLNFWVHSGEMKSKVLFSSQSRETHSDVGFLVYLIGKGALRRCHRFPFVENSSTSHSNLQPARKRLWKDLDWRVWRPS